MLLCRLHHSLPIISRYTGALDIAGKMPLASELLKARIEIYMSRVVIISERRDFQSTLLRQEAAMQGGEIAGEPVTDGDGGYKFVLKINKRTVSPLAFSLWILRRLRSIPGEYRLEIGGQLIPLQMPEAIDLVAGALAGSGRSDARTAA